MWLFNPSDPHSTPTGAEGMRIGNRIYEFNVNVPPYWRLKYRPVLPFDGHFGFSPIYFIPYDIILEFDYENLIDRKAKNKYRWIKGGDTGVYDERTIISGFGPGEEVTLFNGVYVDEDFTTPHFDHKHSVRDIIGFYGDLGWSSSHDPLTWELFVTTSGWYLKQGGVRTPVFGNFGDSIVNYSIEHRENGGAADGFGGDLHCHFDGLGENKFVYKDTSFHPGFGKVRRFDQAWRPDIIIEPFWP